MEGSFKAELWGNGVSIDLNPFVEEFLARTVAGAVSSLKGVEEVRSLELRLERGDVSIIVDRNELVLTSFVNDIVASTLIGLVSALRGVDKVESLRITIEAV